jgi:hypothetical protein
MSDSKDSENEALDPLEPLKREPKTTRSIIEKVLKLENERLNQQRPHLNEDVVRIIKEEIR